MDNKYTQSLLYVMALYAFILIWGLVYFLVPVINYGVFFQFIELTLPLTVLIWLPMILFLLYLFDGRFPLIEEYESEMRKVITAVVVLNYLVVFLFTYDIFMV